MKRTAPKSKLASPRERPSRTIGAAAPRASRAEQAAERRRAILDAALDEFSARGFAAARMEDVANRAGVAKGTIYLHFKDKEELFQELIRSALVPLVGSMRAPTGEFSVRALLQTFADRFAQEIIQTRRGDVIRLVIAEGRRFPSLAEFHYREVIAPAIAAMKALIGFGIARGEIRNSDLQDFPQLIVGPAMVALVWQGLFGTFAPLDVQAMLRTHIDLILAPEASS